MMHDNNKLFDQYLVIDIKNGSKDSFALAFRSYYNDLVLFAGNFIREKAACEDIVQSVFMRLWNDRMQINIETSLKSYLLKSVRNGCLDEIRHQEIVRNHFSSTENNTLDDYDTENYILYSNLSEHLNKALDRLPGKYREAFDLNRMGGLKYKEIAARLNVSERTIEVRISKALQLLRTYLKDFLICSLTLLLNYVIKSL